MSKIYVVLCSHNGERYIESQLRSIIDQDLPVDGIYVHDFASTDNTLKILDEYKEQTNISLIITRHVQAPGASLSFFKALAQLSSHIDDGDCIFLSDQDDIWLPDKVRLMIENYNIAMAESGSPNTLIFHDVKVVDDDLNVIRNTYYTGDRFSIPRDLDNERLLLANPVIGHTMAVSGSLVKQLSKYSQPSGYMMHDWALVLLCSRTGCIRFIPKVLSLYRQHDKNILGAYKKRPLFQAFRRASEFTKRLKVQALTFVNDIARYDEVPKSTEVTIDDRLVKAAARSDFLVCLVLAKNALIKGPTIKHKLLSLYFVLMAFHDLFFINKRRQNNL